MLENRKSKYRYSICSLLLLWEEQWPSSRADVLEPGGPGFDSSSQQPQVVAHQH